MDDDFFDELKFDGIDEIDFDRNDILNMSDDEIISFAFEALNEELANRNNEDYEVNQPQMDKYTELYRFFIRIAKETHAKIEPIRYAPKEEHGDFVIYFQYFYLFDKDVQDFARVMSYTSAFDISVLTNGSVCMSMKVPNIFKKKQ